MHPRLRAGLVIAAVVVASAIAGAAVDRNVVMRNVRRGGGGGWGPGRGGPPPEMEARRRTEMLDRMTKELSLTPAQRAGLDSVFQRTDSSLRAIRREMQPRLKQVFEASRTEMNARLDSTQRQKLASMRFGGPGAWGERRGGGPGRQ
jgi:Spy/CpxP family protein refolding chaperone